MLANDECGGFNFVEAHSRCYFRNNNMQCERSEDSDCDCHVKTVETAPCDSFDSENGNYDECTALENCATEAGTREAQ